MAEANLSLLLRVSVPTVSHISNVVLDQQRGKYNNEGLSLHRERQMPFLTTIHLKFGVGSILEV